jgi:hypothetical protein
MLHHGKPTNSYKALVVTIVAATALWIMANVADATQKPYIPPFKPSRSVVVIKDGSLLGAYYSRMIDLSTGVACYSNGTEGSFACVKLTAPVEAPKE